MRHSFVRAIAAVSLIVTAGSAFAIVAPKSSLSRGDLKALEKAVAAPTRTPANVVRDKYRHPLQTLSFFGMRPNHTVVEIWPAAGWYTEILAPLTRGKGTYYAAGGERVVSGPVGMIKSNAQLYGHIRVAGFPAAPGEAKVPDGSADLVLTFRNVHNWMMGEKPIADEAFRQMYAMLKPGGVLGVVDHRLPENANAQRERTSGYVKVSTVRRLAESAGFRFAGSSEVNANPKDTADWPGGVWTLPPANRGPAAERAKYLAIGESDRMTLKFVKPKA
jgi:predicted methyltransferase